MDLGVRTTLISTLAIAVALGLTACGDDGGGGTDAAMDSATTDGAATDSGTTPDGSTPDGSTPDGSTPDSGPDDGGVGDGGGGGDGGGADDAGPDGANCDRSTVTCRRLEPDCPDGTAPEVDGACWTDRCIRIEECACTRPEQCPMPDSYTCHNFSGRCGPYL